MGFMTKQIDKLTPHTRDVPIRKRGRGDRMTPIERQNAQEKFLRTFSMTANVRAACMSAGISRSIVYVWQEKDEEFSFKFNIAEQEANDLIRAELFRRAVQGYEKPVVSMGKAVYGKDGKMLTERIYSDNLLGLLAKARMPEFRDKQKVEHSGPNGGPIHIQRDPNLQLLTDEELAQAQHIALQLLHRQGGSQ
jgi:hypothetical protein